jgi:DNA-directed RNA polymerase subunit M/transcription elongation factor TFIIS
MATDRPTTCYACGRDITQTVYCVECAHERPAGEKDRQEPPEDRLAIGVHASESDAAAPAGSGRDRICPKCTSNDIYLKWFSMHGLPERLECRCRECGYKWSEPGDDARLSQPEVTDEKKRPSYPGNPYHQALRECFDTCLQSSRQCVCGQPQQVHHRRCC